MMFLQDLARHPFLQHAILAAVLASIPGGIVGSYIVTRRSTYIAGAISHCVLGGMGLSRYLQQVHGLAWLTPMTGAVLAAIIAAGIIAAVMQHGRERIDTVLSAIWAMGMAIGIVFIMATPGYSEDLMSYLFGNILMVGRGDLLLMGLLNLIVLGLVGLFYDPLLATSFNPQLARLRGLNVSLYEIVYLIITALTIVLLVRVVGIVLVIALLTLPAATAGYFVTRLSRMMMLATGFCLLFSVGGLVISYEPEWPAGATIILLSGLVYLGTATFHRLYKGSRTRES
ncbi:MAG: metal ABC transporter permease [Verrucomicrobia bacterium]|nr:metal ABC transporter permease [Kiritimatiellia bacterium]MCP5489081.1 metal ABC transporter permease [Verrucomicrobiota bacterium]